MISWMALTIADMIVIGVVISSVKQPVGFQQGFSAGVEFAKALATFELIVRLGIFLRATLIAAVWTWNGVLPGTRRPKAQPEAHGT